MQLLGLLVGAANLVGIAPALHQQESPRLRTALPNGAVILVERLPEAKQLSVQLFASSRRVPESPSTHGRRHLLEHLLALGPRGTLDHRLETNGCFLAARTHRDAMQFEFIGPPGSFELSLEAVGMVLQPLSVSAAQVEREVKVLQQEIGLLGDAARLSSAAWSAAYGEEGLDPIGTVSSMAASPEDLKALQQRHFAADGLVLVVSGPLDLNATTARVRRLLAPLPKPTDSLPGARRGEGQPGRAEVSGGRGEARGAVVKDYKHPSTVAALAAALAIASQFDQAFVTYTPSTRNGLVLVGRQEDNSGVGLWIDALTPSRVAELFPTGKALATAWVERQLKQPASSAFLRGLLLAQGEAHRPEAMLEAIEAMSREDFAEGMARFGKDRAVVAVGVGR